MGIQIKNSAFGTLSGGITDVQTSIALTAGHGARFPTLAAGQYFYATLITSAGDKEVIKVTARATDTLTVLRAQDGSTGLPFSGADRLEIRPTNATERALQQEALIAYAVAGSATYTATLDPVPTGYNTNQHYIIKIGTTNTGASTLNLSSLGAKSIVWPNGVAVVAGELPAGAFVVLSYDGTNMVIVGGVTRLPTRQTLLSGSGATYTTPTGAKQLRVQVIGGGGSGGGSGTAGATAGTVGNDTTFNAIVAKGGGAGGNAAPGSGGTGGAGSAFRLAGDPGQIQLTIASAADSYYLTGGAGGGKGGGKSALLSAGVAAVANSGGGGSSGSHGSAVAGAAIAGVLYHSGGGEGETAEFLINNPAASYTYTVGASVAGGAAGTGGTAGGAGAAGAIIVDEIY